MMLVDAGGEQRGRRVATVGDHARRGLDLRWRSVAAINRDVEAGLVELLFDVDPAGGLQGQEPGTHPGQFRKRHAFFADVDGGAGEVWGGDVAVSGGGVAIDGDQGALKFDGAHGGVDLQGAMEAGVVAARQVSEETRCPGTGIAAIGGQVGIDAERGAGREGNDVSAGLELVELGVVLDADQAFGLIPLVLSGEGLQRPTQRRNKVNAGDGRDGGAGVDGLSGEVGGAHLNAKDRSGVRMTGNRSRGGQDGVTGVASDPAAGRGGRGAEGRMVVVTCESTRS